jgi:2,3-bisphosphoglycerate-dependent phosphoglycerate mutase
MNATELLIVRHGETPWNVERRIQGWRDIELNETGHKQAAQLGRYLSHPQTPHAPIHAVYSSDLLRAKQTAEAVAKPLGLNMQTMDGVRERNYGILEGTAFDHMHRHHPEAAQVWTSRDPDGIIPEGETLREFQARVTQAIESIALKHPSQRVLVVTHGGAMDMIWRMATGTDIRAPRQAVFLNASINRIQITHAAPSLTWSLIEWANVEHLQHSENDVTP